jgi:heme exporter protein D
MWNSWTDFFAMGGYGLYVWGSFGVTALVMAGEMVGIGARRRALNRRDRAAYDADMGETS